MNGIHSITLLTCINACSSVITQEIQHCPGLWNWFNWHCSFIKCILLLYSGTAGLVCSIDKIYSCLILPQRHIPLKVITWATGRRKQSAGSSPSCTPFSPGNTVTNSNLKVLPTKSWEYFQQDSNDPKWHPIIPFKINAVLSVSALSKKENVYKIQCKQVD